jgi:hypothetical protein
MKFVEKCFILQDDIFRIRNEELCAAITFQSIQKHLYEGHIHFSFLIKKNCNEPSIDIGKPAENVKMPNVQGKKPSKPFTRPNKGVIRGNNAKQSQSISIPPPANSQQQQQNSTNSQASQSSISTTTQAIDMKIEATKNQPPDYSSINRLNSDKLSISPVSVDPFKRSNSNDEVTFSLLIFLFLYT